MDLRQINQWDRIGKPEAGDQFVETWQMTEVLIQVIWGKREPDNKWCWDMWLFIRENIKLVFTYMIMSGK